ncbi:MAG: alpha-galactosidase [Saprospiraceae bacterium]|nr:alpha-galactosidase [Saprospiraceae bacterium]
MTIHQATLNVDGKEYTLHTGKPSFFDTFYVDFQQEAVVGGLRYTVFLHPKQDIFIQHLELQFRLPDPAPLRFFANGYQSRSACVAAQPGDGAMADGGSLGLPSGKGFQSGWTYAWAQAPAQGWRVEGQKADRLFWGSLNEQTGFTFFHFDPNTALLRVRKDMGGLSLSHSFPALDLWTSAGTEQEVFDRWFKMLDAPPRRLEPSLVWTTQGRTPFYEKDLETTLNHLTSSNLPYIMVFFAEGWQKNLGDWRQTSTAFPSGMGAAVQQVRQAGLKAGIWLAPFVAAQDSQLVRQNPEWFLKEISGKNVVYGKQQLFVLNFYHPEVQDYLHGLLHIICDKWGFNVVQAGMMEAVCLAPPSGKTRGQVMHEALAFLRSACGKTWLMADEVPLGSAIGQVDAVRCCPEPLSPPRTGWLNRLPWMKKVDVLGGLKTALARWQLNGGLWNNENGCFTLLDHRFTPEQQQTALLLQSLLGQWLWTSDDPNDYTAEQRCELEDALMWQGSKILLVDEMGPGQYVLTILYEAEPYKVFVNLTAGPIQVAGLPDLLPWETMVVSSS